MNMHSPEVLVAGDLTPLGEWVFSGYLGSPHWGSLDTVRWSRSMRCIKYSKQTALPKNTGDWALLSFPYFFQLQLSLP